MVFMELVLTIPVCTGGVVAVVVVAAVAGARFGRVLARLAGGFQRRTLFFTAGLRAAGFPGIFPGVATGMAAVGFRATITW